MPVATESFNRVRTSRPLWACRLSRKQRMQMSIPWTSAIFARQAGQLKNTGRAPGEVMLETPFGVLEMALGLWLFDRALVGAASLTKTVNTIVLVCVSTRFCFENAGDVLHHGRPHALTFET